MKKVYIFIFSFILFFSSLIITQATEISTLESEFVNQEIFIRDWQTIAENSSLSYAEYYSLYNESISYQNGFLVSNLSSTKVFSVLTWYDVKGNVLKQAEYKDGIIFSLKADGNDIFALALADNGSESSCILLKFNENFEIVNFFSIPVSTDFSNNIYYETYGFDFLYLDDGMISMLIDDKIYYTDLDFSIVNSIDVSENEEEALEVYNQYFKPGYYLSYFYDEEIYYFNNDKKDDYVLLAGFTYDTMSPTVTSENDLSTTSAFSTRQAAIQKSILRLSKDENLIFEKTFDEYNSFLSVKIVANYIVVSALDYTTDEVVILILDFNGNILQKITDSKYFDIGAGDTNFMVINAQEIGYGLCENSSAKLISYTCYKFYNEVFYLPLNVTTKVSFGGKIIVGDGKYRQGEVVTFKVVPDDGYVLGLVKVTDSTGKEVIFKTDTFNMPSADVTIEAEFVVSNPITKDIAIIVLLLVSIIAGIIMIRQSKKIRWLNN